MGSKLIELSKKGTWENQQGDNSPEQGKNGLLIILSYKKMCVVKQLPIPHHDDW